MKSTIPNPTAAVPSRRRVPAETGPAAAGEYDSGCGKVTVVVVVGGGGLMKPGTLTLAFVASPW